MNKSELFLLTESRYNFCDNNELKYNVFSRQFPVVPRARTPIIRRAFQIKRRRMSTPAKRDTRFIW